MRLRIAWAAALMLLASSPCASASPTKLVLANGTPYPQPYQSWVDHAQVPTPPGTITLHLAPCPGRGDWAAGCADGAGRAIYLDAGGRERRTFLHELGHIFDATVMTDPARQLFQSIMRRPGPWVADPTLLPANEWFAEGYSLCARHLTIQRRYFAGNYDYTPTVAQHAAVCEDIRRAAG